MKIKHLLKKIWPSLFIFFLVFLFFWKFFIKGLLPFPGDIIVGLYYPFLDYKWGTTTGVPVKNPLLSDVPSLIYPWRSLVVDQFKNLKFPLWNPHYYLGMPLLANFQSAVFNLGNIFFFFFKKPIAWSLGVISQPLLSMFFCYLFLKNKKLSRLASLFGASVFAFSGFSLAWMEFNILGWTAAFLPLHLLLIDKIFVKKKNVYGCLLSLSLAFQVFSGYIPIVIYSGIILFFYVIFFYLLENFNKNAQSFVIFFSSLLFAGLLSAVQIIPGLELLRLSIRTVDPVTAVSGGGYFPWKNFVTFFSPDFFGSPATYNFWGKPYYDNFFGFVGISALILALSALSISFNKKNKDVFVWTIILFVSLIFITRNPVSIFFNKVNFLSLRGSVWARALFITDFSLAVLSAYGLERLIKRKISVKKIIVPLIAIVFLAAFFRIIDNGKIRLDSISPSQIGIAGRNLILPAAISIELAGLFLAYIFFGKNLKVRITIGIFFLVISIFSLFYQSNKYLSFSRKEYVFPETPILSFLKKQNGIFRIEPKDVLPQNFLMMYGLETISGYDALLPARTGEFLTAVETGKVQKSISRVILLENYYSPLFKLLNVKYILVKKQNLQNEIAKRDTYPNGYLDNPRFKLVFEDKTIGIFEDSEFLPRAWLVKDFVVETDKNKIIERLSSPQFKPEQTVILEEKPDSLEEERDSSIIVDTLDFGMTEAGKRSYTVKSKKGTILFESAAYYPGWRVFIDGHEEKLFRANYAFRAVFVPPGTHEVRLYFEPKSFLSGMILSLASYIFLIFKLAKWHLLEK